MLQVSNKVNNSINAALPKIETRGLGIICREGRNGTVEVERVLPNSLASTTQHVQNDRVTSAALRSGDRISAVIDPDTGIRYPVNSPRKLAEMIEKFPDGLKLEIINAAGDKRNLYFPQIKPASTIGVGVRNSDRGVEVIALKTDFAIKNLKIKEHDHIRQIKIGSTIFDINSPSDLVNAIGKIVPGKPISVIVDRWNSSGTDYVKKTLSATAPSLSPQLPKVGGTSARL
jgi:hypothetical protein